MNSKILGLMIVVMLALVGLYYWLRPDSADEGKAPSVTILGNVDGESVSRVLIEQGEEKLELVL